MNTKRLISVIFFLLVLNPSLWARRPHRINNVIAVRMEDYHVKQQMVAVSCQVNGAGQRHICVIDSGAAHTIISDRVLKAEGPLIDVTTANGVIHVHQREVSLTIADTLELKSTVFRVESSMTPPDVDILLGQDVLRQFRSVIFDYEKEQVEFHR